MYKIFTFDGGGIRGIIPAIWVNELEQEHLSGTNLRDHIDLLAGTSTGSILACGIAAGVSPEKIVHLYEKKGRKIFPSSIKYLTNRFLRVFTEGITNPKYDDDGLEKVIKEVFRVNGQDIRFGELKIPTIVTAYNVLTNSPVILKSTKDEHKNLPLWKVCKASCSAPTYFPAQKLKINDAELPLIDGGVIVNNPALCAITEARKILKKEYIKQNFTENQCKEKIKLSDKQKIELQIKLNKLLVASFGTGSSKKRISIKQTKSWGLLEWVQPLIDILFDGSVDTTDYITSHFIDEDNYFRFQIELDEELDDLDNASKENINVLKNKAGYYIKSMKEGESEIKRLAGQLQPSRPDDRREEG